MKHLLIIVLVTLPALAKRKKVRKVQELNFSEVDINGKVRNPDGALLIQKQRAQFGYLHRLREKFDQNILHSSQYLKGGYEK